MAVEAASPASFQPWNEQTIAGALRPSGRRSQINGCIRITVHHGDDASARALGPTTPDDRHPPRREAVRRGVRLYAKGTSALPRGHPYLTLELRDASGTISGRAFRDADLLAGRFERGDLVRVRGRAERFRGELQLAVRGIARAARRAARPASSHASRDLDELEGFLEHLAREVYDPPLQRLLDADPGRHRAARRAAPGALFAALAQTGARACRRGHHAYLGGLLEHTVAVATLAIELCALHPRLDRDLLLSAAIVHDLGKTREYATGPR